MSSLWNAFFSSSSTPPNNTEEEEDTDVVVSSDNDDDEENESLFSVGDNDGDDDNNDTHKATEDESSSNKEETNLNTNEATTTDIATDCTKVVQDIVAIDYSNSEDEFDFSVPTITTQSQQQPQYVNSNIITEEENTSIDKDVPSFYEKEASHTNEESDIRIEEVEEILEMDEIDNDTNDLVGIIRMDSNNSKVNPLNDDGDVVSLDPKGTNDTQHMKVLSSENQIDKSDDDEDSSLDVTIQPQNEHNNAVVGETDNATHNLNPVIEDTTILEVVEDENDSSSTLNLTQVDSNTTAVKETIAAITTTNDTNLTAPIIEETIAETFQQEEAAKVTATSKPVESMIMDRTTSTTNAEEEEEKEEPSVSNISTVVDPPDWFLLGCNTKAISEEEEDNWSYHSSEKEDDDSLLDILPANKLTSTSESNEDRPMYARTRITLPPAAIHESLFEILDRNFSSCLEDEPDTSPSRKSRAIPEGITPCILQLCFVAFVIVFTPPPLVSYGITALKEEGNDGPPPEEEEEHMNSHLPPKYSRPDIPLRMVYALWTRVLTHLNIHRVDPSQSEEDTATIEYIQSILMQLSIITKVNTTNANANANEKLSLRIHEEIHYQYGQYLVYTNDKIWEFVSGHEMEWNESVVLGGKSSKEQTSMHSIVYPWILIRAMQSEEVYTILVDADYIRTRMRTQGIVLGCVSHVTDVDNYMKYNASSSSTVMKEAYKQLMNYMNHTLQVEKERSVKSKRLKELRLQIGISYHVLGTSFGGQGCIHEEMECYETAIKLKRSAYHMDIGSTAILTVDKTTSSTQVSTSSSNNPNHLTISHTLHSMGYAFDYLGDTSSGMKCYEEALRIRRNILGDDHELVASTLHNMGALFCESHESEQAFECLDEALRIREEVLGSKNRVDVADTLQWLGNVFREWEDWDRALDSFEAALEVKEELLGSWHIDVASALHNMAVVLDDVGEYEDSLQCYTRAAEIRKRVLGEGHEDVSDTLQCMGNVHCVEEHLEEALQCFTDAIAIREAMVEDIPNVQQEEHVGDGLLDVAILLQKHTMSDDIISTDPRYHNYSKMIEIYEEILPLEKILSDQHHQRIQTILNRMGNLYEFVKDVNNAVGSYQGAYSIQKFLYGEDHSIVSFTCEKLGSLYFLRSEYERSLDMFSTALHIQRLNDVTQELESNTIRVGMLLYALGIVYFHLQQYEPALSTFQESLLIWNTLFTIQAPRHITIAHTLRNIGDTLEKLHKTREALSHYLTSYQIYKTNEQSLKEQHGHIEYENPHLQSAMIHLLGKMGNVNDLLNSHDRAMRCYREQIRMMKTFNTSYNNINTATNQESTEIVTTMKHHHDIADALYNVGNIYTKLGQYTKAIRNFGKSVHVSQDNFGENDVRIANANYNMGILLCNYIQTSTSLEDSLICFEESLRIFVIQHGDDSSSVGNTFHNLGCVFDKMEQYDDAMGQYQQALIIRQDQFGNSPLLCAQTWFNMGMNCAKRQLYEDSIYHLEEALRIRKGGESCDHSVADTLYAMAKSYEEKGNAFDKAMVLYKEALRIRRKLYGGNHVQVAKTLYSIGWSYYRKRYWDVAIEYLEKTLQIQRMEPKRYEGMYVSTIVVLAEAYEKSNKFSNAIQYFEEALKMLKDNMYSTSIDADTDTTISDAVNKTSHESIIKICRYLGECYENNDDFDTAINYYQELLPSLKEMYGDTHEDVADALFHLGSISAKKQEYTKALIYLKQSLKIRRVKLGNDHLLVSNTLHNMGVVFDKMNSYQLSIESLVEALRIRKKTLGADHFDTASTFQAMGTVFDKWGKPDSAIECFAEALRIRRASLGEDDVSVAKTLSCLASSYTAKGRDGEALNRYMEALNVFQEKLGKEHLVVADTYFHIGILLRKKSDVHAQTKASNCLEEALTIQRGHGSTNGNNDAYRLDLSNTLHALGQVRLEKQEIDQALSYLNESLEIKIQLLGEEHLSTANTMYQLGKLYTALDVNEAHHLLTLSLETRRMNLPDDHLSLAESYITLADMYVEHDETKLEEAMKLFNDAYRITKGNVGARHIKCGICHLGQAKILIKKDDIDSALEKLQEAYLLFEKDDNAVEYFIVTLYSIGICYSKKEMKDKALTIFEEGYSICKEKFGHDDSKVADLLIEISKIRGEDSENKQALECFKEALRIRELVSTNEIGVAEVLILIGSLCEAEDDLKEARESYERSLQILKTKFGPDHTNVASVLLSLGDIYDLEYQYEDAFKSYEESLRIYKKQFGPDDLSVAIALNNLGINYAKRKDFDKGIEYCKEALRIRRMQFGESVEVADTIYNIGNILFECKMYDEAIEFYSEALNQYTKNLGENCIDAASALQQMGLIYESKEMLKDSMRCFLECLHIYEVNGVNNDDNLDVGVVLFSLGKAYSTIKDFERAKDFLSRALRIRSDSKSPDNNTDVALTQFHLAYVLSEMDLLDEAMQGYLEALRIFKSNFGQHSTHAADALFHLGKLKTKIGEYERALEYFEKVNEIYKENKEDDFDENIAATLHAMGEVHDKRVDYEEAMRCYGNALLLRRKKNGNDDLKVAETLFEVAKLFDSWGDADEAIEAYNEVLRIRELVLGIDSVNVAEVLVRIAGVYDERQEYDIAMENYKQGLKIYTEKIGRETVEVASVIQSMGGIYDAWNQFDEALKCYEISLQIFQVKLGHDHLLVAKALNNIGINYARHQDYENAIKMCKESLRIRKKQLGGSVEVADTIFNIANIFYECEKYDQAMEFYFEAYKNYKVNRDDSIDAASALHQMGLIHEKKGMYDDAYSDLMEALRIYELEIGDDNLEVASVLNCLGNVYLNKDNSRKAIKSLERSLDIRKRLLDGKDISVAETYLNLGVALQSIDSLDDAMDAYKESIHIYKVNPSTELKIAKLLNNIGIIHAKKKELEMSIKYLEKSKELYKEKLGEDDVVIAKVMIDLGEACSEINIHEKAVNYLLKALTIFRRRYGNEHVKVTDTLNKMGTAYIKNHEYQKAMSCFENAVKIKHLNVGVNNQIIAESFVGMAIIHEARGRSDLAIGCYKEEVRLRTMVNQDSIELANTMFRMGCAYAENHEHENAVKCMEDSLRIRKLLLSENHSEILETLDKLEMFRIDLDKHQKAVKSWKGSII